MAEITGAMGTSYNLPNYTGELFALTPSDTPFLSAIGGLTGGKSVNSTMFEWSTYDLRAAANNRQRVEGADAPAADERVRGNVFNVVEIHQEAVELSYTKLAAVGLKAAIDGTGATAGHGNAAPSNVTAEMDWQLAQALKQVARDVEVSFLSTTARNVGTAAVARKTQGLLGAITTNTSAVVHANLWEGVTQDEILDLVEEVWQSGGISESDSATLLVNSAAKRALTRLFITGANYQEQSRNVGGVNVQTIETDFGRLNIMLDRNMPTDTLAVVSLNECVPVFLEIPGKGHFFAEPLAKTGSAEKVQIYGEIGLEYGAESHHGKLTVAAA